MIFDTSYYHEAVTNTIAAAVSLANEQKHLKVEPIPLMYALYRDSQGAIHAIISNTGGTSDKQSESVLTAVEKLDKRAGGVPEVEAGFAFLYILCKAMKGKERRGEGIVDGCMFHYGLSFDFTVVRMFDKCQVPIHKLREVVGGPCIEQPISTAPPRQAKPKYNTSPLFSGKRVSAFTDDMIAQAGKSAPSSVIGRDEVIQQMVLAL
ncbi:hypothetical protein DL89DRAFT_110226 [Linderina pennispora]|uniref:Clp R domain-containing protein n=1 Tax=Linderina pennispora TaxID=61395 RepID=A0A1Y1WF73_9FUNG|nr:uncharacterized protein DL89DRAFT_110226 [Linderina pennispora]ORX72211.1 hypothetical protein DL89DRAFT_110226 [Linderina pennispora]